MRPLKSASDTVPPPSRGSLKSGAFSPAALGTSYAFLSSLSRCQCAEGRDAGKGLAERGSFVRNRDRERSGRRRPRIRGEGPRKRGDFRLRMTGSGINSSRRRCVRSGRPCVCMAARWPNAPPATFVPNYHYYRPHLLTPRSRWARRLLIGTGVVAFAAVAVAASSGGSSAPGRSRSTSRRRGSPRRSRSGSAAVIASRSAARCWSATRSDVRRCACATSWCATRRARSSPARRRPRSA